MEIQKRKRLYTLAIVILNCNGVKWFEKFLQKVIDFTPNTSIYVIDNDSSDNSISYLKGNFPEITIIQNQENYGYAQGYNEGLKNVNEDIYCLLNSDVEVTDNWTEPILYLFESDSNISAIQPKILDYNNKEYFEFAGAGGGFIDNLGYPYCKGRLFDTLEKDDYQYNGNYEIFWASGASLFIRKLDFWSEGGFDNLFFAHMEEIDLCWRLKNNTKKIYYCGTSTVYHAGGGTLNNVKPKKTFLNFRNNLLMLTKNLPKNKVLYIIILRLFLDGIAGIKFIFSGKIRHCFAIIKAHFSFYRHLLYAINRRSTSTISRYYDHKNIVFQYFIRGRKIYKDLK